MKGFASWLFCNDGFIRANHQDAWNTNAVIGAHLIVKSLQLRNLLPGKLIVLDGFVSRHVGNSKNEVLFSCTPVEGPFSFQEILPSFFWELFIQYIKDVKKKLNDLLEN
jgi:hypothetical protein